MSWRHRGFGGGGVENGSDPLVRPIAVQHVRSALYFDDLGLWKPTPKASYCPRNTGSLSDPCRHVTGQRMLDTALDDGNGRVS